MKTQSIEQIEESLKALVTSLDKYKEYNTPYDKNSRCYGRENDYSLKDVEIALENIISDLKILINSHRYFWGSSSYSERSAILNTLYNLVSSVQGCNPNQIIEYLDNIKVLLRPFTARKNKEMVTNLLAQLSDIKEKSYEFTECLKEAKQVLVDVEKTRDCIIAKQEEINQKFEEISKSKTDFETTETLFNEAYTECEKLNRKADEEVQNISKLLETATSQTDKFNEFVDKIDELEKTLKSQNDQTEIYKQHLTDYQADHNKLKESAQQLIDQSKQALQYTTASGLSAAFQTEYNNKDSKEAKVGWLVSSGIFVAITIGIGAWIVCGQTEEYKDMTQLLFSIIGRFSMIPLIIYAAYYCANQYNKQKILANDYAYKTALAKSIVPFSEALKSDTKQYQEYISTVMKEIHQDPLRDRNHKDTSDEIVKVTDKFIETIKVVGEVVKKTSTPTQQ